MKVREEKYFPGDILCKIGDDSNVSYFVVQVTQIRKNKGTNKLDKWDVITFLNNGQLYNLLRVSVDRLFRKIKHE